MTSIVPQGVPGAAAEDRSSTESNDQTAATRRAFSTTWRKVLGKLDWEAKAVIAMSWS
jgi:hypothetical protein